MTNNNEKETFDAAVKSEAFFEKNKKVISGVIIAVIVIVAGILCYNQFIGGPRQDKASTALARGQEYFNADQFDKALNGDGAGYTGFVKIADDYSSTDAGNLANLYAGLCYANLGKWQDAVKYLENYSPKGDAMVSPAAIEALGNAYAHVGQIDKAISTLKEAASKADDKAENGTNDTKDHQGLGSSGVVPVLLALRACDDLNDCACNGNNNSDPDNSHDRTCSAAVAVSGKRAVNCAGNLGL